MSFDVEIQKCVITRITQRGDGKKHAFRNVTEVWVISGDGGCIKIAENDPLAPIYDKNTGEFTIRNPL